MKDFAMSFQLNNQISNTSGKPTRLTSANDVRQRNLVIRIIYVAIAKTMHAVTQRPPITSTTHEKIRLQQTPQHRKSTDEPNKPHSHTRTHS